MTNDTWILGALKAAADALNAFVGALPPPLDGSLSRKEDLALEQTISLLCEWFSELPAALLLNAVLQICGRPSASQSIGKPIGMSITKRGSRSFAWLMLGSRLSHATFTN